MEECKHVPDVKVEGGLIITYCQKCGKILDTRPTDENPNYSRERWQEGLIQDNGGSILHD